VTIAEVLRGHGYKTAFMGKWHLGTETYYYPEHQGFDVNVAGRDYGAPGSYFFPFTGKWKIPSTGQTLHKKRPLSGKKGDFLTDRLAEEAESFIRKNSDNPFFLMLSHYAVHTPLQGKPGKVVNYEKIPENKRQGKPAYAAMIESVDESVGRVTRVLRELGLEKSTLVIFTSDNGGFAGATSNAPLRANKGSNYEGGIRVPAIVKWPKAGRRGVLSNVPIISMDYFPTILAATGHPLCPHQHIDGVDLTPVLKKSGGLSRDAIYWHYPHYNRHPENFPAGVIRANNWKLLQELETGKLSLYDLADDIGETKNLASRYPEKVKSLLIKLKSWQKDVGADPMRPNPEYKDK